MNWDYIAGFFDGEGNLHITPLKKNDITIAYQLKVRLYSSDEKVLLEIKNFVGYGSIYLKKGSDVYELNIVKKENVYCFLTNILNKLVIKRDQTNFVLENYSFKRENNLYFDVDKFRSFIKRKSVVRKHKTIYKDSEVSEL